MKMVAEYSDLLGTVTFYQCEDEDSADHLHFHFKIDYCGYKEESNGVLRLDPEDTEADIQEKFCLIYAANAKRLHCDYNGITELTIH
jgi:hypothetical protein